MNYNAKNLDPQYLDGDDTIETCFSDLSWKRAKPTLNIDGVEYTLKAKSAVDKRRRYKYVSPTGNKAVIEDDVA